jgi:hypothetical protein
MYITRWLVKAVQPPKYHTRDTPSVNLARAGQLTLTATPEIIKSGVLIRGAVDGVVETVVLYQGKVYRIFNLVEELQRKLDFGSDMLPALGNLVAHDLAGVSRLLADDVSNAIKAISLDLRKKLIKDLLPPDPTLPAHVLANHLSRHIGKLTIKHIAHYVKLSGTGFRSSFAWLEEIETWIVRAAKADVPVIIELVESSGKVILKHTRQGVVTEVGEFSGDIFKLKYPHFGQDIVCHAIKTTTIVGRYEETGGLLDGIKHILRHYGTKYGEFPGGINALNDPGTWADFWKQVNEPWLIAAIARGDVIRAVSNPFYKTVNGVPTKGLNIFQNMNNIPPQVFNSATELASYLKNMSITSAEYAKLTYYGREVHLLSKHDYIFDPLSFNFVK